MTIKIIFERSSQKGGRQGVRKEGQQGTHLETLFWGNPNGGLANGGLAQKAPIGPKKALSGEFLLPPSSCEVRRNRSQSAPKRPR